MIGFKWAELFSVLDGVELKRKKLRLVGSLVTGERGDFGVERGVDWLDIELAGTDVLFKRIYERFDEDSDDVDEGDW